MRLLVVFFFGIFVVLVFVLSWRLILGILDGLHLARVSRQEKRAFLAARGERKNAEKGRKQVKQFHLH
jgi:hypothetical protein